MSESVPTTIFLWTAVLLIGGVGGLVGWSYYAGVRSGRGEAVLRGETGRVRVMTLATIYGASGWAVVVVSIFLQDLLLSFSEEAAPWGVSS